MLERRSPINPILYEGTYSERVIAGTITTAYSVNDINVTLPSKKQVTLINTIDGFIFEGKELKDGQSVDISDGRVYAVADETARRYCKKTFN